MSVSYLLILLQLKRIRLLDAANCLLPVIVLLIEGEVSSCFLMVCERQKGRHNRRSLPHSARSPSHEHRATPATSEDVRPQMEPCIIE